MSNVTNRLLDLKREIEERSNKKAEMKGKLSSAMERLKDEFGLETIEEAEEHLKELQKQRKNIEAKLNKNLDTLEELLFPPEEEE